MPVLLGSVLAAYFSESDFSIFIFVLCLTGMILFQAAANILNDYYDYIKGLDTQIFPGSGAIVRGLFSATQARRAAFFLFFIAILIGLLVAFLRSYWIIPIGAIGLAIAVLYSATNFALKYLALGDIAIFFVFGILGTLGAWTAQAGAPALLPAFLAIPLGLLIVGILHANNWRDSAVDLGRGFQTIASLLGNRGSERYYRFLLLAPYFFIVLFFIAPFFSQQLPTQPVSSFIVFFSLPHAWTLLRRIKNKRSKDEPIIFASLDAATAKLAISFTLLYALGFMIAKPIGL